jgi:hypothetical protein
MKVKTLSPGLRDWAPNYTRMETQASIARRSAFLASMPELAAGILNGPDRKEEGAGYSMPLTGSSPLGIGFTFQDSFRRTKKGTMEFQLPFGQSDTINTSLRFAVENVFVGKALRLKTNFTCKGLSNSGPKDETNAFFDDVISKLRLQRIYRAAVWLYYSVGFVPILLTEPGKPLSYVDILDPRMVKMEQAFNKTWVWMKPDKRMMDAVNDPQGTQHEFNKIYFNAMPAHWRAQLQAAKLKGDATPTILLKDGECIIIQNRYCSIDRTPGQFDGTPLQPYFSACELYRMLMAGDFAAAFLMKNLIALVSVGDPKSEGDNYQRPDDKVLGDLQAAFQNPNQAQWSYVDPTMMVRYIHPDPEVLSAKKYDEPKEQLKNLLPAPFWFSDGNGSFAASTTQLTELQEEVDQNHDDFDTNFWKPIFTRASEQKARIADKDIRAPKHDRNSLKDNKAYLDSQNNLFSNGGLSTRSLMEAHGVDPDVETQRLKDQQADAKAGVFMPAFEQKQGIVAAKTYGIQKQQGKPDGGKGGRPRKAGSKPNAESTTRRTPRPSEK